MIFFDTETCGLYGMPVLIQYSKGLDGEIKLFSPWGNPIHESLRLIEEFCADPEGVVAFNISFDWFQLCKLYTVLRLFPDHNAFPIDVIDEIAELEPLGRDGPCIKPVSALDIMLHARKGPYQSTMDREDIRIRRVPTALAWQLADELERRVKLSPIYFAKRKDRLAKQWIVKDIEDEFGEMNTDFKDVILAFRPSSALKALAVDALKVSQDDLIVYGDVELNDYPEELGYAPFARAIGDRHDWKGSWPSKIARHHNHWMYHERARKYAMLDVQYLKDLWVYFGKPALGDDDSVLACMVPTVRWKGFKIDYDGLKSLREKTIASKMKLVDGKVFDVPTSAAKARYYIEEAMDATEKLGASMTKQAKTAKDFSISTKKVLLIEISEWTRGCEACEETGITKSGERCLVCNGTKAVPHPSASRAREVLEARQADYEVNLFDKFLLAGRFHASFNVIGALSSRMSGADGLNPQGVKKTKEVRSKFPLAFGDNTLCGGDFAGFEVTLAEACYGDPDLRRDLLTCESCEGQMERIGQPIAARDYLQEEGLQKYLDWRTKLELKNAKKDAKESLEKGIQPSYIIRTAEEIKEEFFENDFYCHKCGSTKGKKIHALFGVHVYPDMTYEQIKATEGTKDDRYTRCKSAVFAMFYGGEGFTLKSRLGVDIEIADRAYAAFVRRYVQVGVARKKVADMFCSMTQPRGLGTKVIWKEPADYIDSMFGFRRYFTLENKICKALFDLANKPPASWKDIQIKVTRRERVQTAMGAVQSALYGAAFGLQAANTRAAMNHVIQSSGATVTKMVQRQIWELQPAGVSEWIVQPMNIHDEIMCPTKKGKEEEVKKAVFNSVESLRPKVPLIKMDWVIGLNSWAEKG